MHPTPRGSNSVTPEPRWTGAVGGWSGAIRGRGSPNGRTSGYQLPPQMTAEPRGKWHLQSAVGCSGNRGVLVALVSFSCSPVSEEKMFLATEGQFGRTGKGAGRISEWMAPPSTAASLKRRNGAELGRFADEHSPDAAVSGAYVQTRRCTSTPSDLDPRVHEWSDGLHRNGRVGAVVGQPASVDDDPPRRETRTASRPDEPKNNRALDTASKGTEFI
jgi:hypothetical protein